MRWKLTIEYDGLPFRGWQKQSGVLSVQQIIEEAIEALTGEQVSLHVAGRTDAGVHALAQIAHFDLQKSFEADKFPLALNSHLRPFPIAILAVQPVSDEFHARFDACARHYLYRIINRCAPLAIDKKYALYVAKPLDLPAMQQACTYLLGKHDFTSFRARACQAKSPIKTITHCDIVPSLSHMGHEELHLSVHANGFLYHQVRNMVGTLIKIGKGKWHASDMQRILQEKNRVAAGPTVPPHGLYLQKIIYPDQPYANQAEDRGFQFDAV